jgi:hypothetical protein
MYSTKLPLRLRATVSHALQGVTDVFLYKFTDMQCLTYYILKKREKKYNYISVRNFPVAVPLGGEGE